MAHNQKIWCLSTFGKTVYVMRPEESQQHIPYHMKKVSTCNNNTGELFYSRKVNFQQKHWVYIYHWSMVFRNKDQMDDKKLTACKRWEIMFLNPALSRVVLFWLMLHLTRMLWSLAISINNGMTHHLNHETKPCNCRLVTLHHMADSWCTYERIHWNGL